MKNKDVKILIIDDETPIREALTLSLEDEGFQVYQAKDGEEGLTQLRSLKPDIAFLDVWMPGLFDGLQVLEKSMAENSETQFVIMSGHGTIETAVKAVRLGAWDFIEKPLSIDKVQISIHNILNLKVELKEKKELLSRLRQNIALIGGSASMKSLKKMIARVAPGKDWVYLRGPAGSGKQLVAQNIHYLSPMASGPFVTLNCHSLAPELVDLELFGFEAGSLPGADQQKRGRLEVADSGTLVIEDVELLSGETQKQLFSFLTEQKFFRKGGLEALSPQTRLILTSQEDLSDLVASGKFHEGLYHRLSNCRIEVPSLSERKDDLFELIDHFSGEYYLRTRAQAQSFSDEAKQMLVEYRWPGNVRELKNFIERLHILTPHEDIDVPDLLFAGLPLKNEERSSLLLFKDARAQFEKEYLVAKISEHGGSVAKTAEAIGLERSYLYRKMKSHGIEV